MGKKLHFTIPFVISPKPCPKTPIFLDFPLRIIEGTVDYLKNGLHRTGNFHLFPSFMDQFFLFIS